MSENQTDVAEGAREEDDGAHQREHEQVGAEHEGQTHPDGDGDGFCDAPYTINAGFSGSPNVDHLPLRALIGPAHPGPFPGTLKAPLDLDGDGKYEDVNGNERKDFADITLYFHQMAWIGANEPLAAFDYNENGRIDFADVVWLFNNL